ncbi:hypothetical protein EWM64_g7015 [Hericium alpestre]|uniref:Uncharacterized protein n=1 Tax=Hericium alpestre TaxID=135208 RepID=A0A4Y9ZQY7_9AGAM|nr:hypothetical protein EWM64_g7015 [Hericium alpestre]
MLHTLLRTFNSVYGMLEITFAAPALSASYGYVLTGSKGWFNVAVCPRRTASLRGSASSYTPSTRKASGDDDGMQGPRGMLADVVVMQVVLESARQLVDLRALATM